MKILTYILLLFSIISCDTVLTVDLPEDEEILVVNSLFSNDTSMLLHVSKTVSVLSDGKVPHINSAEVALFQDGEEVMKLDSKDNGLYQTDFEPKAEVDYTLRVKAEGLGVATTKFRIPKSIPIKSAFFIKNNSSEEFSAVGEVKITIDDPANERNFYMISVYSYDFANGGYVQQVIELMAPFDNSEHQAKMLDGNIANSFVDGAFDGEKIEITAELWSANHPLYCNLYSISEDFYLYIKSLENQEYSEDNPFSQPTTVRTNIEGGAGIVGVYSLSRKKITIIN